jgi:3-oxoacyl-[acyl-carrier protein] reductase
MDLGLAGAAVCISGGTKGMGREAAIAFAREGARVVVTARGVEGLNETVEALRAAGSPDTFGVQTDVGQSASIDALFRTIGERWGVLNTLVNMAGPTEPSKGVDFTEISDVSWQYCFDVGVMSIVRCTRAAVPLMRKADWARVVNISSTSSRLGMPAEAPYTAAKNAVNALSKNMAWTLARENILVNTVTPGAFHTEALRHYMEVTGATARGYDADDLTSVARWVKDSFGGRPMGAIGRVAKAGELASILLLLGSPANSYIVGANIPVDGGTDFSPD